MSKQILTVDDSVSMRQMITFTLKGAGYDVVEAVDGNDAVARLSAGPSRIHMIITDLNMPNMDGIELIRYVRANSTYRFIPIVMLTTESQEAKKQEARSAGATGWITKPFRSDQLLAVVKKVLG